MDINKITIIGRLTKNADVRYTSGGMCVVNFSIASNRRKDKQGKVEVDYFDCTLFGLQGEKLSPYLVKGKQVAIDGALRQERWEKEGRKHSKVSIVADTVQLIGGTKSEGRPEPSPEESHAEYMNGGGWEDVPF